MVILYLDIETLRTSLRDKIIAIGISTADEKDRKIWKEWEHGEENIIKQFYDYLESLNSRKQTVWIIGFNILKFDIPALIYKAIMFGIDVIRCFELWHYCYVEDERQILLPLNNFRFKGLKAEKVL